MKTFLTLVPMLASCILAQQTLYGQCGGSSWTGPKTCTAGAACQTQNQYYAQCVPGTAPTTKATTVAPPATTMRTTTVAGGSGSTPTGKVQLAGVNIAGCDFGCDTSVRVNVYD